ncbi:MAG TPA: bacteriocin [Dongiaceae bacterium]|jgi:bacteriocin-like protein|nr:bacteriocin [Dongiaceae bacterium]
MAADSKKDPDKKGTSVQKPQATKKELSEKELAKVSGGFNPQPEPPGRR